MIEVSFQQTPPLTTEARGMNSKYPEVSGTLRPDQAQESFDAVENVKRQQDLINNLKSGSLNETQSRNALDGFIQHGGNIIDLGQKEPTLTPVIEYYVGYKQNQLDTQRAFFDSLNQLSSVDPDTLAEQLPQLEKFMDYYEENYQDFSGNLITEEGLRILGEKNPKLEEWYREQIKKRVTELRLRANDRAFSFLQKITDNPEAPAELRVMAKDSALTLLADTTSTLKQLDPNNSSQVESKAIVLAQELGLSASDLNEKASQQTEELILDFTQGSAKKEEDFLDFLGLRTEKGEIKKAQLATLGTVVALLVLADQVIAKTAGSQAVIPFIFDTFGTITQNIERQKNLARIKAENPDVYTNYYSLMGYDENSMTKWLIDWAKKKFSTNTS